MDLNRRNTESVIEQLKVQDKIISEQTVIINGLISTMSVFSARMDSLEQLVRIHKAQMMGTGSSVIEG